MNETIISYSRRDREFVQELVEVLHVSGIDPWWDLEDIKPGVKWAREIKLAIQNCHNFVFIISEHSVNSKYCLQELECAVQYNKRVIPLLYQKPPNIPSLLRQINWVYYHDLAQCLGALLVALTAPLGVTIGDRLDSALIITTKNLPTREVFLYFNYYNIGRSALPGALNSIIIQDKFVSRSHISIVFKDNRWHVQDCNSTNGCFLNDHKLKNSGILKNGDTITISRSTSLLYTELKPINWLIESDESETLTQDQ